MNKILDCLIVGGGQAGAQAAISLREAGYTGSIGIAAQENHYPYERPPLSKAYMTGDRTAEDIAVRPVDFWSDMNIEILLGRTVTQIRATEHIAVLDGEDEVTFEKLIWAAGGRPRTIPLAGCELAGVHQFRTIDDAQNIRERLAFAQHAVIIGGGYIGLEAAAAFRKAGVHVTVLEAQERLLARVTSPMISDFFAQTHRNAGVQVVLSAAVHSIVGDGASVTGVRLQDGTLLPAQLVLIGVGLIPNTDIIAQAGASCSNGVDVDGVCRTSLEDVYAIGDVANYVSVHSGTNGRVRLESVPNAMEHGRIVAANITGSPAPAPAVPWFWSNQYAVRLQTAGLLTGYDQAILRGDPSTGKFSVVYLLDGVLIALDAVNQVKDFVQSKILIPNHPRMNAEQLADPSIPLEAAVETVELVRP